MSHPHLISNCKLCVMRHWTDGWDWSGRHNKRHTGHFGGRRNPANIGPWNLSKNSGMSLGTCAGTTGMEFCTTNNNLEKIFLTAGLTTDCKCCLVTVSRQYPKMCLFSFKDPLTNFYRNHDSIKNNGWPWSKQQYKENNITNLACIYLS